MIDRKMLGAIAASTCIAVLAVSGAAGAATKTTKKITKTTKKVTATTKPATTPTAVVTTVDQALAGTAAAETAPTPTAPPNVDREAEVRIGVLSPSQRIDPHRSISVADWTYEYPVYDRLLQVDDDLRIQPMLAASWKASADAKSLEFTLRKDILFHDGSPINAAAVKANIERGKTLEGSTVRGFLAPVQSVDVVNDNTVRFNLSGQGGAGLMAALTQGPGMMINPKAFGKNLDLGPGDGMGSGPYRLVSYKALDSAVYERANFKYWDPSAGLLKKWTLVFSTSANILNGIKAGDYVSGQVSGVNVADAQNDTRAGRVELFEAPQRTTLNVMMLKVDKPGSPAGNKTLRQALAFGINKRAIGEFLFQGNCRTTETYYQPGHWVYDADSADRYRFDPSRAKSLVKDSGIANPSIRLMFDQGSTTSRPIAEAIADQVEREIGIKVQLDPRPNGALLPAWQANEVDAYVGQLSGTANIDPENFLNSYFMPNPSTGLQLGVDPAALARAALPAANAGFTLAQRAAAYKPIFDGIQETVPFVAICNQVQSYPKQAGSKLKGKVVAWWSGLPDYRNLYVTK